MNEITAEAARVARAILAEIDDPDAELTASAAMRNRLEGAAATLDAVSENDR